MTIRELIAKLRHADGCDCPCDRCALEKSAAAVIEQLVHADDLDADVNV